MQGRQTTLERRRSAVFRLTSVFMMVAGTTGCAVSYVDSKNVRHIIGFVDVALPMAPAEATGPTPSVVSAKVPYESAWNVRLRARSDSFLFFKLVSCA